MLFTNIWVFRASLSQQSGVWEPPFRKHRATWNCHQKHYSTVLLTWASTAYVFTAKRQTCPCGHVCLSVQVYHMPTHIKSLSRHNISDGSHFWNDGSAHTGLAALPHKNIHHFCEIDYTITETLFSTLSAKVGDTVGEYGRKTKIS